jgi:hypothetical protein
MAQKREMPRGQPSPPAGPARKGKDEDAPRRAPEDERAPAREADAERGDRMPKGADEPGAGL